MLYLEMNDGLRPRMQSNKIVNLFAVCVSLHPLTAIRLVSVQLPLFPAKREQADHTMDRSAISNREFENLLQIRILRFFHFLHRRRHLHRLVCLNQTYW